MSTATVPPITLSEAVETYISQKGVGRSTTFEAVAQRACKYLVDACGFKKMADYSRTDALNYRQYLINRGLFGIN